MPCHPVCGSLTNGNGWTGLDAAALQGDEAVVELMLAYGADPRHRDREGLTAIDRVETESMRALLERVSGSVL
jgi:hypothetical protein